MESRSQTLDSSAGIHISNNVQIHDEIVIEVEQTAFEVGANLLKTSMEIAWQLRVPMEVQLRKGPSWGELELWKPPN